jgi:hypothetical protein
MSIERAIRRAHATRRDIGVRDVSSQRRRGNSVDADTLPPALPATTHAVRGCLFH